MESLSRRLETGLCGKDQITSESSSFDSVGQTWGLIPAGLIVLTLIYRIAREDRFLHAELEGYQEYAARTRYRLLPGIR